MLEKDEEEVAEQEESSRLDEVEEMVRDMVLVFFCTFWTLSRTHQHRLVMSQLRRRRLLVCPLTVPCSRRSRKQRQRSLAVENEGHYGKCRQKIH